MVKSEDRKAPRIIARKVNVESSPLAFGISSEETISGTIPYFEGPNSAL